MTFVEKHECLERLKEWLRKGRRGSLTEMADAFKVSTRTMKRWVADIRKYEGWDIEYCRVGNRYGEWQKKKICEFFFSIIPFFVPARVHICYEFNTMGI